jgi:hypothetical protein
MKKEISDIISERYKILPEDVQHFLSSDGFVEKVKESSTSVNLSKEQAVTLENETVLVLLGMSSPEEFPSLLERELNITKPVAIQLSVNIDKNVFARFREYVNDVYFEVNSEQENVTGNTNKETSLRGNNSQSQETQSAQFGRTETNNIAQENLKPATNRMSEEGSSATTDPGSETYQGVDPYREPVE